MNKLDDSALVFHVYLERADTQDQVGLGLETVGNGLQVMAVVQGLAVDYNKLLSTAPAPLCSHTVELGDLITCINGYAEPRIMMHQIRTAQHLHLRVERLRPR